MKKIRISFVISMCMLVIASCKKDDTTTPSGPSANFGQTSSIAGSGSIGSADGTGAAASFNYPVGLGIDASGNIYVADRFNHRIRKVTPAGVVTTLAGNGTASSTDGTGTAATFNNPWGIVVDGSGNLFVTELYGNKIRKITPAGVVTTVAGSVQGYADGTGTAASFNYPSGIVLDASGNLFVADGVNNRIRKVTQAGVVTTFAGSGVQGNADGTGTAATFKLPFGLGIDAAGNLYAGEEGNGDIRKITAAGVVTTLAGNGTSGSADGTGAAASFNDPWGVTCDASGNIWVADTYNHKIRKITPAGVVTTFAGTGVPGNTEGKGILAAFSFPVGIVFDAAGDIYIGDSNNQRIRKLIAH